MIRLTSLVEANRKNVDPILHRFETQPPEIEAVSAAVADFKFQEGAITTTTTTRTIVGAKYVGWSIGGGVEVGITRNVVGRVEYLYDDFGSKDYIGITGDPYHVSFRGQTVRGALAWKFDGLRP